LDHLNFGKEAEPVVVMTTVACPFCKSGHAYAPVEIETVKAQDAHAQWQFVLCRGALRKVIIL